MNRRDFLRRLTVGGVAAATAAREWPFRVFSFPQEIKIAPIATKIPPEVRVRFIRAFDPAQAKMLNRWDVLYGFMNLDEANRAPYIAHISSFDAIDHPEFKLATPEEARKLGLLDPEFKLATPEEARKLGLLDPRYADAMDSVCEKEDSEFETTAIASPQRFLEGYESEES